MPFFTQVCDWVLVKCHGNQKVLKEGGMGGWGDGGMGGWGDGGMGGGKFLIKELQ